MRDAVEYRWIHFITILWLPLLHAHRSLTLSTFLPLKSRLKGCSTSAGGMWVYRSGFRFYPPYSAKAGIEAHPTQHTVLAPKPIVSQIQIRHFGNFEYIGLFNIKQFTLQLYISVLCSWLHASSRRFSKYKGQSSPQHHWSSAEIGHLAKPPAFKYPLPKPENDDYCSPFLIISFLSQKRNIKRERPYNIKQTQTVRLAFLIRERKFKTKPSILPTKEKRMVLNSRSGC